MKYFFITGMGRSGTTFLASMLSGLPGVKAGHEMIGNREFCVLSWYMRGTSYSKEYLQQAKRQIEQSEQVDSYIDVDGYLQYATDEIQEVFHPHGLLHLVRNPKEVIRSTYTRRIDGDIHILPKEEGEIKRWLEGDRFQQICANWKMVVEPLLAKKIPLLRFEDVIEDYDYLNEKLLRPFGLALPKNRWEKLKDEKINRTRTKVFRYVYSRVKGKTYQPELLGVYDQWTPQQKKIFQEYCGPFMEALGYA